MRNKHTLDATIMAEDMPKVIASFENKGFRIASSEEVARTRIEFGKDNFMRYGRNALPGLNLDDCTKEGLIYLLNQEVRLTHNSPIIADPKKASRSFYDKKEFLLSSEELEIALKDSIKINEREIPTNRLGEDDLTNFIFGKSAQAYGDLLNQVGYESFQIALKRPQTEQPVAHHMELRTAEIYSVSCKPCFHAPWCRPRMIGVRDVQIGTSEKEIRMFAKQLRETRGLDLSMSKIQEILDFAGITPQNAGSNDPMFAIINYLSEIK